MKKAKKFRVLLSVIVSIIMIITTTIPISAAEVTSSKVAATRSTSLLNYSGSFYNHFSTNFSVPQSGTATFIYGANVQGNEPDTNMWIRIEDSDGYGYYNDNAYTSGTGATVGYAYLPAGDYKVQFWGFYTTYNGVLNFYIP